MMQNLDGHLSTGAPATDAFLTQKDEGYFSSFEFDGSQFYGG